MKKVYIHSAGSVSSQNTFSDEGFLEKVISYMETVIPAIDAPYKEFIPPAAARRMAKGVKMGIAASTAALKEAGLENVDGVITGSGMGCLVDSEKFLRGIIDNQEQHLTPTSFIQSTHNTVGGQIALNIQCKGYNFTYVHGSVSFESALMDAFLQLKNEEATNILVGGVDELGEHTVEVHKLIARIKKDPVPSEDLYTSKSIGAVFGEGAQFFVLSNEKRDSSYAELLGLKTLNTLAKEKVASHAEAFLKEYDIGISDIDLLITGDNGDQDFDGYYDELSKQFPVAIHARYKHLTGEYHTVSSFGFWAALKALKLQLVPAALSGNADKRELKHALLYNQYRGIDHGFTLLRRC